MAKEEPNPFILNFNRLLEDGKLEEAYDYIVNAPLKDLQSMSENRVDIGRVVGLLSRGISNKQQLVFSAMDNAGLWSDKSSAELWDELMQLRNKENSMTKPLKSEPQAAASPKKAGKKTSLPPSAPSEESAADPEKKGAGLEFNASEMYGDDPGEFSSSGIDYESGDEGGGEDEDLVDMVLPAPDVQEPTEPPEPSKLPKPGGDPDEEEPEDELDSDSKTEELSGKFLQAVASFEKAAKLYQGQLKELRQDVQSLRAEVHTIRGLCVYMAANVVDQRREHKPDALPAIANGSNALFDKYCKAPKK